MLKAIGALAIAEAGQSIRRSFVVRGLQAAAALVALVALGFGLAALHIVLAARFDAMIANLIIAGGLLGLALILLATAAIVRSRPRKPSPAATTALALAPVAAGVLASKPGLRAAALGGVLLLGAALGRDLAR